MLDQLIDGTRKDLGGFDVGRILPHLSRRAVGPFVFLDHIGPAVLAPGEGMDVRPHPHIGLATLTYLFAGGFRHRDSLGVSQLIRPGEVNWMVAGRGVTHSERMDPEARAAGGPLHGLQAWIALPEADEEMDPSFTHVDAAALPTRTGEGWTARLIAGTAWGEASPVPVRSPLVYIHVELAAGARFPVPADHAERGVVVAAGSVTVDGVPVRPGQLAMVSGESVVSAEGPATVAVLGGAPLGPRHLSWNFVSSRRERIEDARADWKAGRFVLPPGDDQEWILLP